jgi:hypothetical protein
MHGLAAHLTMRGVFEMTEYFITYRGENCPKCRCSIADLSNEELAFFKKESDIANNSDYDLDSVTPLNTVEERFEHREALKEFERGIAESIYYEQPHIRELEKFQSIAEKIRRASGRETTTLLNNASARSDAVISKHIGNVLKKEVISFHLTSAQQREGVADTIDPVNPPSDDTATDDEERVKLSANHERDYRLYVLARDPNSTWGMVAEIVNQEFPGEQLDPDAAAAAAKRYQKKHKLANIPERKPGRKPKERTR